MSRSRASELIRPSTREDIPGLDALFREVFGSVRGEALWRWKYFENPRGCFSHVCEAGGRIVAHCGGTPVRFRDGQRASMALQSVDFMSSSSHPGGLGGGGVFLRTANAFFRSYCGPQAVPLVYGFPGERHRALGERLLGYSPLEPIAEMRAEPLRSGGEPPTLELRHLELFGQPAAKVGALRDVTYLRWRYLVHPTHRYGIVRARSAAAIVRMSHEALYLMEIGGNLTDESVAAVVLACRGYGVPVVWWGSEHHAISSLLENSGLATTVRDHYVEYRFFVDRTALEPGELYFTLGDYDVY